MTPSIGRIVHVTLNTLRVLPAIITSVHEDGSIDVQLFGLGLGTALDPMLIGIRHSSHPPGSEDATRMWGWPPRV